MSATVSVLMKLLGNGVKKEVGAQPGPMNRGPNGRGGRGDLQHQLSMGRWTRRPGRGGGWPSMRYNPGAEADRQRPLAQARSRSTCSAAVTATGTTLAAACVNGTSKS